MSTGIVATIPKNVTSSTLQALKNLQTNLPIDSLSGFEES
jgi:hypothetical protein